MIIPENFMKFNFIIREKDKKNLYGILDCMLKVAKSKNPKTGH
jgi:hypothetical protein